MSVVNANPLLAAAGGDYQISRSVRLRSSASAYFNRTPASTGNRQIMTFSFWMKRGLLTYSSNYLMLFNAYPSTSAVDLIAFSPSSDSLRVWFNGSSSADLITTQVFRDPSAWYHVVVAIDTTQATSSNRIKVYVNGSQITSFSTATYPSQNYNTYWNSSSYASAIGANLNGPQSYFDGYLTEINFIDGQALTPSSFGEYNTITGVWQPKKYAGTYGTNGFYLNFSDNSSNTATTIGKDYSGNGNNWTPNNISVTAGVTYDSMLDVPTPYADGGNGRGNYAVLNPLKLFSTTAGTYSNANLTFSGPNTTNWYAAQSSITMSSGKWYFEATVVTATSNNNMVGIAPAASSNANLGVESNAYAYLGSNGNKQNNNTQTAYGATYTANDVIGAAFDADAGTLTFYKNGVSQGTAFTGITGEYAFEVACNPNTISVNFGQRPFAYTAPSGFKALNTQNLPDATIKKGNAYFDATTYTGNGSALTVTNNGSMQPDLLWTKQRSSTAWHYLQDAVRGVNKGLFSNATDAEYSINPTTTTLNSNGFSFNGAESGLNANGATYVAWQWKESVTAGFDIVTYTGDGTANRSVSHSLGVAPAFIVVKNRTTAGTSWLTWHKTFATSDYIRLNTTDQKNYAGALVTTFGGSSVTAPSSTAFHVGSDNSVNQNTNTFVAYLFAEVAGFSKFGSYTGNGSSDGPFVYCGFRPRWVMVKRTDTTGNWAMIDTSRLTYNPDSAALFANLSNAEGNYSAGFDVLSNGFKLREPANSDINLSGGTYIFAAFAEVPFRSALAR